MSVSSYSSECSSSSSSSNSSSTSSGATGKFSSSSSTSFSSCSTIVEAQPHIRPFGYPVFNYFWIEKRSKTFPKKKYYWNFKSHSVVWERPVPKDVPLPVYTNAQTSMQRNTSDNEDIIVSEPEDAIRRKRRLAVKMRNRRLVLEEKDNTIQVLSVKKTIKSKKMLDTFWKLYRYPGESVSDVKKRLLNSIENTIKIKSELDSNHKHNANDVDETSVLSIKQEPPFNEDNFSFNLNSVNNIKKDENEDSDSDPEHVSRLIKQEYMMHYEESEIEDDEYDVKRNIHKVLDEQLEKDSEDEDEDDEDSEEDDEESVNFNDIHQDNYNSNINFPNTNEKMFESESDNFKYEYEVPYLQEDLLSVEINEDNNGNIFLPVDDEVIIENINWNFDESSEVVNNSRLTYSAINSLYEAPKIKQITSKHLLSSNRKKRKVKTQRKKKVPKLIIKREPCFDVKSEPESSGSEKPIICDRYGVRTINYNHPPKVKLPNWQVYTKLSDSSGDDSTKDSDYKSKKVSTPKRVQTNTKRTLPDTERNDDGALELRNWFPKRRGRKRKKNRYGSDSSWCESDLSDCTSVDEFDLKLIRMKKEKRTCSSEREVECSVLENSIIKPSIKMGIHQESSPAQQAMESKILGSSTTLAEPAVDLSRVKVEVPSDLEEQIFAIKVEENAANDADHSDVDSSSSSSHTCSRSSCSRCSSSSSSSSSSSDSDDDAGNKNIVKEQVDI